MNHDDQRWSATYHKFGVAIECRDIPVQVKLSRGETNGTHWPWERKDSGKHPRHCTVERALKLGTTLQGERTVALVLGNLVGQYVVTLPNDGGGVGQISLMGGVGLD